MSQTKVLADRIYQREGLAADVVRIVAANILLALCAHIAIPLPWTLVPITGQTFGVLFVAVLLGSRRGAIAIVLYLLEGMAGLPVFQPYGLPGPARFFGPTAGYLLAYPPAAFLAGWLMENARIKGAVRLASALFCGEVLIFLSGCAWLATAMGLGWSSALQQGALPFLPGEIIKMAVIVVAVRGFELAGEKVQGSTP